MWALVSVGEILVVDPLQAMAGDVPVRFAHGGDAGRIARERVGDAVNRHRNITCGEHPPQAPEPGARAVFEHRLDIHVAPAAQRLYAEHVAEKRFGLRIAVHDAAFPALFEVHDELDGDPSIAGPARIGLVAAVALEIARILRMRRRRHCVTCFTKLPEA
jgi:hypothetical protein